VRVESRVPPVDHKGDPFPLGQIDPNDIITSGVDDLEDSLGFESSRHVISLQRQHAGTSFRNTSYYEVLKVPSKFVAVNTTTWTLSSVSTKDDQPAQRVNLDFTFDFYGYGERVVWINPNGFVAFNDTTYCMGSFCGWTGQNYKRYIAPIMSDFDPSSDDNSTVWYQLGESEGKKRLIVTWQNLKLWLRTGDDGFTFQVILWEDGVIDLNYQALPYNPQVKYIRRTEAANVHYTLVVGCEDSSFPIIPLNSLRYGLVELEFADIHVHHSIELVPLVGCSGPTTCNECITFANSPQIRDRLTCAWCPENNWCTDPNGKQMAKNSAAGCAGILEMRRTELQCTLKEVGRVSCPEEECKSQSEATATAEVPVIAILIGIAVGFVFFVIFVTLSRTLYKLYCARRSAVASSMGGDNREEERFSIMDTKEWRDAGDDDDEAKEDDADAKTNKTTTPNAKAR